MAKNFVRDGDIITYSNTGAAIASGDVVVIGNLLGVALVDIAATTGTGAVAIEGVYSLPKVSAAVIAQGETVVYKAGSGNIDDNLAALVAGDLSVGCVAANAAAATTLFVDVMLNIGTNTVT